MIAHSYILLASHKCGHGYISDRKQAGRDTLAGIKVFLPVNLLPQKYIPDLTVNVHLLSFVLSLLYHSLHFHVHSL
jgi:hypothetical protein